MYLYLSNIILLIFYFLFVHIKTYLFVYLERFIEPGDNKLFTARGRIAYSFTIMIYIE